jgi:hypothetical protein
MENSFQTSFIPKKPISNFNQVRERHPMGILSFLAILIVAGVMFSIGGLFLYKNLLTKQKVELSKSLEASRESFEQKTIDEIEYFSKKIDVSRNILANHYILSPFFDTLEKVTIPTIQFTKFNYQVKEKDFLIQMSGIARDYTSIALQSNEFNENTNRYFKNVVFSNLVLLEEPKTKGYVSFDVSFLVDQSLLSFKNNIGKNDQSAIPSVLEQVPIDTTQESLPKASQPSAVKTP